MSSTTLLRRNSSNISPKSQRKQINSMIAGDSEKYLIQQNSYKQNIYSNNQHQTEPTNVNNKMYLTNKIDVEYLNEKLRKLQAQNESIPENFNSNNVIRPRCIVIHRSKSNIKRPEHEQQQTNFHHQTRKENDRSVSNLEHYSNLKPVKVQYNEETSSHNNHEVEETRNVSNLKCNLVRSTHRDILRNRKLVIHNQNAQQRTEQPNQTSTEHKIIYRSQSQLAYNPIAHITKTQSFNNNPNELLKSNLNSNDNNNNNNNKMLPTPTFKTSHSFHLDLNSYGNKTQNTSNAMQIRNQHIHSNSSSSSETADRDTPSDLDEHRCSSKERDLNNNNQADDADEDDDDDFENKCSTVTRNINEKLNRHLSLVSNVSLSKPQRAIVIRREKTVSGCTMSQLNKSGKKLQNTEEELQTKQDKQRNLDKLRKSLIRESSITLFNNKETTSSATSGIEMSSSKNSPSSRTTSDETHNNLSVNGSKNNLGNKFENSTITDSIIGSSVSSSAGSFKFNESERNSMHSELAQNDNYKNTSTSQFLEKINELKNRLFIMEVELKNEKKKLNLEKEVKSKLLFEMKNRYESEKQAALQALEAKLNAEKLIELNKLKDAHEAEKREEFDLSQKSFDSELLNLKVKMREKSEKCQQLEKLLKEEHNKNANLFAKSMEVVRKYNEELKNLNQLKEEHQQEMNKKKQTNSTGTQTISNTTTTTGLQTSLASVCSETHNDEQQQQQQQQAVQVNEATLKKHLLHIKSLFSCTNLNHKHQEQQTLTSHLVDIELLVKHTLKLYSNLKNELKTFKEASEKLKLELDDQKESKCKLESLYKIKCKSDLNKSACIKKLQINYDCELIKLRNEFNSDLVKFLEYKLNTKDSMIIDYFNYLEYWLQLLSPSEIADSSSLSKDTRVLLDNVKKVKVSIENLLKSNLAHSFTLINNNPHEVEITSNLNSLINGSYKRMPINLIINSNKMSSDSFCNEISSHEYQTRNSLKINVVNESIETCKDSNAHQELSNLEEIQNSLKQRANEDSSNLNRFTVSHVMSHSLSNHTNRSNNTTEFTSSHSLFETSDSLNNRNNEINDEVIDNQNANSQNEFIQYIQVYSNRDQQYDDEDEDEPNEYDNFSDQQQEQHEQTNQYNQASALSPFNLFNVINSQVPMKYLKKSISLINLPTHISFLSNEEEKNEQKQVKEQTSK